MQLPSECVGFHYVLAGGDGRRQPLLLLHKTGGDERELLPFADRIAPGAPAIGVRGTVVEDGKHRFFRRLSPGVFDEDDVRDKAERLAAFVDAVTARHALDRPVAVGLSNGANIAAAMLQLRPGIFSGAVLLRPAPPFSVPPSARRDGTSVLIIAGTEDTTVPAAESRRLASDLTRSGADIQYRTVPAGHRMVEADTDIVRAWLSTHFSLTSKVLIP